MDLNLLLWLIVLGTVVYVFDRFMMKWINRNCPDVYSETGIEDEKKKEEKGK